jgi:hypothetical protein
VSHPTTEDETIAIEVSVQTNRVGSRVSRVIEFDLDDWNRMPADEREKRLFEALTDENLIEWDWKELP